MIFGKTKLELKVGIFVFIGLIILTIFVLSIGNFKTWTSGYYVKFLFNFTNGIKLGAPVRFAGVDVGEVKGLKFKFSVQEQTTRVEIISWIKKETKIPLDSTVWVNTLGLLGEKYIEVMPGKDYNNCLLANQSLTGVDPIPMHEMMQLGKDIAANLDKSIIELRSGKGTVGKLLYDDALYKEIEALVVDLRKNPWKIFWKTKEKK